MSLMLKKKGGKVFAPKLPAARRPGVSSSAPSSARPSIERQSQTPAPVSHPVESISLLDQVDIPDLTREPLEPIVRPTPQQTILEAPNDSVPPQDRSTIESGTGIESVNHQDTAVLQKENLKRKATEEREGAEIEIPLKRHQPTSPKTTNVFNRQYASILPIEKGSKRMAMVDDESTESTAQSEPQLTTRLGVAGSSPRAELPERSQVPDIQSDLAQQEEPGDVREDATEHSLFESNPIDQPSKSMLAMGDEGVVNQLSAAGHLNPSRTTSLDPDTDPDASRQPPIPENAQDGLAYEYPDPELSSSGFGHAGVVSGLGAAGDIHSSGNGGGQLAQVPQIVPTAPLNPDGTPGEAIQEPAVGTKKKKVTKRRKIQAAEDGDDVRATIEMQLNRPRRVGSRKQSRKKKDGGNRNSKRAMTPEGAEDDRIDHATMTMYDLCKDLRIGKKFSKHEEIKQRDVQKKVKTKMSQKHPELVLLLEGEEGGREAGSALPVGDVAESDQPVLGTGPQMRVIDGQIVLDDSSLQIDRHKRAQAERLEMEEVEENEFTRITTSGTFMKRERAQLWDTAANDIFYKGLRMFGTDFEMIAKMFPHRNRRQIKLKFNKEERTNAVKINKILMGTGTAINMEEYETMTGLKFEEVADIEAERDRIEAEQNAEQEKHDAEQAEATRRKKEAIQAKSGTAQSVFGSADEAGEKENEPNTGDREASAAPKSRKKAAPKKKQKNKHTSRGDGGGMVEVLGPIEG